MLVGLTVQLNYLLNQIHKEFHSADFLSSDPLEFVYRYTDPLDQEATALLAALLAYGNVKQIRKSVEDALLRIHSVSKGPRDFVQQLHRPLFNKKASRAFLGFVHRFNVGSDLIQLFLLLNRSWKSFGSLGGHFTQFLGSNDLHIGGALSHLISEWREWEGGKAENSFSYLLTSPADGSCCKRWCMFLRWMGRKDQLDPGLWTQKSPLASSFLKKNFLRSNQLIMPLDTHTSRISQYIGLTDRKTVDWKTALDVTESLKKLDPNDPTRYDFALARLGILDLCQRSYREEICKKCQLLPVCRFAQKFSNGRLRSTVASV